MDLVSIAARVAAASEEDGPEVDTSVVRKTPGKGYCVKSEKNPDWNGGCFPSKGEAEKRLNQVEYFKHKAAGPVTVTKFEWDHVAVGLRVE